MKNEILDVTENNFEEKVLKNEGLVLVDFWAEWCGPCKMLLPVIKEVANEWDGNITIAKVNVDTNSSIGAKYGVRGIPTLLLVKSGEVIARKVGALGKKELIDFIENNS